MRPRTTSAEGLAAALPNWILTPTAWRPTRAQWHPSDPPASWGWPGEPGRKLWERIDRHGAWSEAVHLWIEDRAPQLLTDRGQLTAEGWRVLQAEYRRRYVDPKGRGGSRRPRRRDRGS